MNEFLESNIILPVMSFIISGLLSFLWILNQSKRRLKAIQPALKLTNKHNNLIYLDHADIGGYELKNILLKKNNEKFHYNFSQTLQQNSDSNIRLKHICKFIQDNYSDEINSIDGFINELAEKIQKNDISKEYTYIVFNIHRNREYKNEKSVLKIELGESDYGSVELLKCIFNELFKIKKQPFFQYTDIEEQINEHIDINTLSIFFTTINLTGVFILKPPNHEIGQKQSFIFSLVHSKIFNREMWDFSFHLPIKTNFKEKNEFKLTTTTLNNTLKDTLKTHDISEITGINTNITDVSLIYNDGLEICLMLNCIIESETVPNQIKRYNQYILLPSYKDLHDLIEFIEEEQKRKIFSASLIDYILAYKKEII